MKNYAGYFLRIVVLVVTVLFCFGFSSEAANHLVSPSQDSRIFYQGINHLTQENYQQAIINFTQVINKNQKFVAAAYANRCLAHLQLDHNQAAKEDCTQSLKINSDNVEAYLNQGMADYRLGNLPQSLTAFQAVIQRNKDDYRAYYNQGLVYFDLKNYQAALDAYQKALNYSQQQTSAEKSSIYYDQGLAYLQLENFPKAIANFTQAMIFDQTNDKAYYYRGYAYHQLGDYQASIQDFNEVITLNSQLTVAYINRGLSKQKLGLLKAAFRDLSIAVQQFKQQNNQIAYQQTLKLIRQLNKIMSQPFVVA